MEKKLEEIALLIGGELAGKGDVTITGVSGIKEAKEGDITFLANPKYVSLLEKTQASAVLVGKDVVSPGKPVIRTANPSLAFSKVIELMGPKKVEYAPGVHPSAVIGKNVKLGKDVSVQPCAVVADGAVIGDRTVIGAGVYLGLECVVGCDTLIYPNVVIRERTVIGSRVIVHSGTVIGSDGFGFAMIDGRHMKIPQIGIVVVEDDVEIGANVAVDRARFDKTIIKKGTKIDNLVQIAHNVIVGSHSILVAQCGIAGSTELGSYVTMAAQAGAVGHLKIGDGAIIAAQAGVTKDIEPRALVVGAPAIDHMKFKKNVANVNRLPKLIERVEQLEQKIADLEKHRKDT